MNWILLLYQYTAYIQQQPPLLPRVRRRPGRVHRAAPRGTSESIRAAASASVCVCVGGGAASIRTHGIGVAGSHRGVVRTPPRRMARGWRAAFSREPHFLGALNLTPPPLSLLPPRCSAGAFAAFGPFWQCVIWTAPDGPGPIKGHRHQSLRIPRPKSKPKSRRPCEPWSRPLCDSHT